MTLPSVGQALRRDTRNPDKTLWSGCKSHTVLSLPAGSSQAVLHPRRSPLVCVKGGFFIYAQLAVDYNASIPHCKPEILRTFVGWCGEHTLPGGE